MKSKTFDEFLISHEISGEGDSEEERWLDEKLLNLKDENSKIKEVEEYQPLIKRIEEKRDYEENKNRIKLLEDEAGKCKRVQKIKKNEIKSHIMEKIDEVNKGKGDFPILDVEKLKIEEKIQRLEERRLSLQRYSTSSASEKHSKRTDNTQNQNHTSNINANCKKSTHLTTNWKELQNITLLDCINASKINAECEDVEQSMMNTLKNLKYELGKLTLEDYQPTRDQESVRNSVNNIHKLNQQDQLYQFNQHSPLNQMNQMNKGNEIKGIGIEEREYETHRERERE